MNALPREPTRSEWRAALIAVVAIFVATRVLLIISAVLVEFILPLDRVPEAWDDRPVLASLTSFDAVYYLGIADEGYHAEPVRADHRDWVFFPAFPFVVRAASVLTVGDVAIAAVLVSNLAFVGALAALYALSRRYFDHATSIRSLVYLAIAPGAVAFAMAYSESLFLLLAVGAFLAAERGRWVWMAALIAAASLTRLPGVLLIIPLAILIWRRPETPRSRLVWLAAGPLAVAGFAAYQGAVLGDPLAFLSAQSSWNFPDRDAGLAPGSAPAFDPTPLILTAILVLHVFLLVYIRADAIPLPYAAMSVISILTVLGSLRLLSLPRYFAVVWPFDWILANRRAEWFRAAWPVISAGLFVLFAVLHFTEAVAP